MPSGFVIARPDGSIEDLGDTPLELRLAIIFLRGAEADDDLDDDDIAGIARYLRRVFRRLGSPFDPAKVLRSATRLLDDDDLLDESVELLNRHLSKPALAGIVNALRDVLSADGLADDEEGFLADLVEAWQVGHGGDDEGELGDGDDLGDGDGEEEEDS